MKMACSITKKGQFKDWEFDWTPPQKSGFKVFALYADGDEQIQGLIATNPVKENIAIKINIVESAPFNNKHNPNNEDNSKEYGGVGGHLFAEAVKQSYNEGFGGAVYFQAKTNLVNYYERTLGAVEIANNRMMLIDGKGAAKLYEEYYEKKTEMIACMKKPLLSQIHQMEAECLQNLGIKTTQNIVFLN
jgi:hypothetical protein